MVLEQDKYMNDGLSLINPTCQHGVYRRYERTVIVDIPIQAIAYIKSQAKHKPCW